MRKTQLIIHLKYIRSQSIDTNYIKIIQPSFMKTTLFTPKLILLTIYLFVSILNGYSQKNPSKWAIDNYHQYTKEATMVTDPTKADDIESFRQKFKKKGYRKHQYGKTKTKWNKALQMLTTEGTFKDLQKDEKRCFPAKGEKPSVSRDYVTKYSSEIWNRLGIMADAVVTNKAPQADIYTDAFLKAILYYGEIEINRSNYVSRFHESCFAIPTAAMNIYYAFLDRMDEIEKGEKAFKLEKKACDMLKTLALQAWTQPIRKDKTDNDVTSIERFQHHVWWVGGNGLAYRSLLPVACMYKSIPMIDVLAEVAQKGISNTSQVTNKTSFWTEGFTADGAGWGHGMQCLVWGYPIDGTASALSLLSMLKGTVWEQKLNEENKAAIMNYIRGSNWYHYKGYNLPCLGRSSFAYAGQKETIKSRLLIESILKEWKTSFTSQEIKELKQFDKESLKHNILMSNYENGMYNGTRWFFNNDDLIKKEKDYHIIVNMSSVRCDGIESAINKADTYNFTTCDGLTLFQRSGREYMNILGAFDVLQAPGVTARLGQEKLIPATNWRGYCSKYNFATAATNNGANAVAGFKFEKMNASDKKGTNDTIGKMTKNDVLYGVQAYKSYFMLGDYMVALGAGVTNLKPEIEGEIHTTIEQTSQESEIFLWKNGKKSSIKQGVNQFNSTKKELEWLIQEGKFAYTVLPEFTKNSFFTTEVRKTDWVKMNLSNKSAKDAPQSAKVLQAWTDHGDAPVNDQYAYVVYAGDNMPAKKVPFQVLRNDTLVQAVASTNRETIEAVFYQANQTLNIGTDFSLVVSAPCAILLEKAGNLWNIAITDAEMNEELKQITVTINGKQHQVEMPKGKWSGKCIQATI